MKATNLVETSLQSKVYTQSYGPSKLRESRFRKFQNFHLGVLGQNAIWVLGVSPMAKHKVYYKGEGGGFPQVWAMVNFVSPCLFVVCPCTKNVQTMH
jgi:hypothetical protein